MNFFGFVDNSGFNGIPNGIVCLSNQAADNLQE